MSRKKGKGGANQRSLRSRVGDTIRLRSFRTKLILYLFFILMVTSAFTFALFLLVTLLMPWLFHRPITGIIACLIACTVIGTITTGVFSRIIWRPLNQMIEATKKISKGDFNVHIEETMDPRTDFGILQHSFNHMVQELGGIEMFRNDFINNFSHEFKTPIVSIQGFARQLQAGGLTEEEQKEYLNIIVTESDRLAKMSSNILLLSKLENQQIVTDKMEFYLDEQIRKSLLVLEKQWSQKDIELDIDLDEVKYCFNEDMLSQIWINLFSNAIKFTPPCGKVTCTLRTVDPWIIVTVSDTGEGMSDEVRAHIFEKFYQGDTSHSGAGNGIGLTIVGRILELCGGHIKVESRPGMGSTFTVYLPVTVKSPEAIGEENES